MAGILQQTWQCVVPENIRSHHTEGHWKFLGGGGVLDTKFLEAVYDNKPEFPGGGGEGGMGCKTINLPWGENGYFLELHNAYGDVDPIKHRVWLT